MSTHDRDAALSHEQAHELLPWLVNGTLRVEQRAAVEAHLAGCEHCLRELDWEEGLRARVRGDDTVELAPQAPLRQLLARLDEAPPPAGQRVPGLPARGRAPARRPRVRRRRSLLLVIGAQSIAIVSLVALLAGWWYAGATRPDFVTLTTQPPALAEERPAAFVVPSQTIRPGELGALFSRLRVERLSGPNAAGAYLVAPLAGETASEDDWLQRLQSEPDIAWVVPRRDTP